MNNADSYYATVNSNEFIEQLNVLNNNMKVELIKHNYIPTLIGNLFYDHEQMTPPFYNSPLLKECEMKRIRFSNACKKGTNMFEIGLNGGHSTFLAMSVNEKLIVYSNDISEHYPPCPKIHPEIYVPVAANTLKTFFEERFTFIKGSCITEVPMFVKNNPSILIDLVHIDGDKITYKNDFLNLMPSLKDGSIIIFDDSQNPDVQNTVDNLIKQGYLHRMPEFPKMDEKYKYRNEILMYKK